MRSTELYIEQILIGSLVIAIFSFPWLREIALSDKGVSTTNAIVAGSAWIGLSFLLGVPFDRLSDTLTSRIEGFSILFEAFYINIRQRFPDSDGDTIDRDLFELDKYLIVALNSANSPVSFRIDYHRARIRIARALFVFGPGLTVSLTVGTWRLLASPDQTPAIAALTLVGLVYTVWLGLILTSETLPRTNESSLKELARNFGWLREDGEFIKGQRQWIYYKDEWLTLTPPLILILVSVIFGITTENGLVILVGVFGGLLSILCLWSYWRINETYLAFIFKVAVAEKTVALKFNSMG